MRVLQINKFFYEKGGTERYYFSLCKLLAARGHSIAHFAMQHPRNLGSPHASYFVGESDYGRQYGALERLPRGLSFIRSREAAENVARLIDSWKPDIAHLHNIYHQITPSILPVLANAGVPVVLTLHDYKLVCPNYSLFDGLRFCYRCRGGRFYRAPQTRCSGGSVTRSALIAIEAYWQRHTRVYDTVKFFLAPSRYIRDVHVEAGFGSRVVYLPSFIDPEESLGGWKGGVVTEEAQGVGKEASDQMAVPGSGLDLPARYVVYFGRLSAEKGLMTLLRSVRTLDGVELVICGDGPQREHVEKWVRENGGERVRLLGHLDRAPLARVVRGAVCAVIPTESPENAPFSAMEAMMLGVPIVVSRIGGLPEMAARCGAPMFEPGDARQLSRCILRLWQDATGAREIGDRAVRVAESVFSPRRHIDALEALYGRACVS